jgi:small subunit ribosomal protein S15e
MIILPEEVGSMVSVYKGKAFKHMHIKQALISHPLGNFSITYRSVKHDWPGISATYFFFFIPFK